MTTTHKPTSAAQAVTMLGFSINQAAAILAEADNRNIRKIVVGIAERAAHEGADYKATAKAKLSALIPPQAEADLFSQLDSALGDMPALPEAEAAPAKPKATRKPKPSETKSAATVAGERIYCTEQPPVLNGRRILWAESAQRSAKGIVYVNIGTARRTIGASADEWRAILVDHRDELLAVIRELHDEAAQA